MAGAETVKVIVRCRPMNGREHNLHCKNVLSMDSKMGQCTINTSSGINPKSFTFDGAYFVDSTTEEIYSDIGYPLVEGVTEGFNGTIFAYGQTGCGKSFTMQGVPNIPGQRGIIPRAFDHIFETIAATDDSLYLVHASYSEIYNEDVRDLLGKDIRAKLDLKEHPEKGVYVQGLSMMPVKNVKDCERIMELGWKNRATGATLMNAESSRSHSIFSIHLERQNTSSGNIRVAKLNLVDLAGSERQAKTGSTGDRLKEATKINLSLSALGNVISALVNGKSTHIPYRDSKLTRLLQDSLGGNTKTLMIACLSPADNNYDETLSTLRYANRAKNIKNKPKVNEDPKDTLLREYAEKIAQLEKMVKGEIPQGEIKEKIVEKVVYRENAEAIETERAKVKEEYENRIKEMQENAKLMQISNEKMQQEMNQIRDRYETELATIGPSEMDGQSANQVKVVNGKNADVVVRGGNGLSKSQLNHKKTNSAEADDTEQVLTSNEAQRRLAELKQQMVGGEMAGNQDIKERRKKRLSHAQQKRLRLAEAIGKMEDEGMMLNIYDNIQDELREKTQKLQQVIGLNKSLKQEVLDLQSEFEQDRVDYLETIRKQGQEVLLIKSLLEKIAPCLRRDSNYANLDKIKDECYWNEDMQNWVLPKMTINKTKLPAAGGALMPGGRLMDAARPSYSGVEESNESSYKDFQHDDAKLYQALNNKEREDFSKNYFKPKRTDRLLNQTENDRHRDLRSLSPRRSHNGGGLGLGLSSSHEEPIRRPIRLEALEPTGHKHSGRKKRINTMDEY